MLQKPFFAPESAAKTHQFAVFTNHLVAGNNDVM
jgi:hypothetical protein